MDGRLSGLMGAGPDGCQHRRSTSSTVLARRRFAIGVERAAKLLAFCEHFNLVNGSLGALFRHLNDGAIFFIDGKVPEQRTTTSAREQGRSLRRPGLVRAAFWFRHKCCNML